MKSILDITLIIAVGIFVLSAQSGEGLIPSSLNDQWIEGIGLRHCSDFLKSVPATKDFNENPYFAWTAGMLTGFNEQRRTTGQPTVQLAQMTGKEQFDVLVQYCQKAPRQYFSGAVSDLGVRMTRLPGGMRQPDKK